jgi:hypothetical protein
MGRLDLADANLLNAARWAELSDPSHHHPLTKQSPQVFRGDAGGQPGGAYQERSPLGMLRSAPNESYSESSVTGFGFVKSSSSRS